MTSDLFLTPGELEQLTGRRRGKEQREQLDAMGVRWLLNAAGETLVGRRHVEEVLCGTAPPDRQKREPNIGALAS
ncbi:DUF4224 domain-containing protein [Chromohalobacter sp. 296-RDG]|uniref:DUF4224 domain-containing protein n=1 Tax=Chromohalobacter sp. 296-RDG TaxID=2994062 RepID=UPI0024698EF3|nr:DUF4224 domain-containing protein [Chromohalobacter sp. 296-RDG]